VPSLARGLVACAWFGINTWIGGSSVHQMLQALSGDALPTAQLAWLGISGPQLGCFMAFWTLQLCVVVRGIDTIKTIETCSAPILIALALVLLAWAVSAAGGFGPMLSAPSQVGGEPRKAP
jgi:NCS1 family nucleobase:cation symporter-1